MKIKKKVQSPEQFKSKFCQLLKEYNFFDTTRGLNFLKYQADGHNNHTVKKYQGGEWSVISIIADVDLSIDIINILKDFRLMGDGHGIQKITIILEKDQPTPIINLEINYFGIE